MLLILVLFQYKQLIRLPNSAGLAVAGHNGSLSAAEKGENLLFVVSSFNFFVFVVIIVLLIWQAGRHSCLLEDVLCQDKISFLSITMN